MLFRSVIAVNLHTNRSYADLRIPVPDAADYVVALNSDDIAFGGQGRVDPAAIYQRQDVSLYGRSQSIQLYLPSRTAQVLAPI